MIAILRTYGCDGRFDDSIVNISDDHKFEEGPYVDTVPFPVGSNQSILSLEDTGLIEMVDAPLPTSPLLEALKQCITHGNACCMKSSKLIDVKRRLAEITRIAEEAIKLYQKHE